VWKSGPFFGFFPLLCPPIKGQVLCVMQLHPTDSAPQLTLRNNASEMAAVIHHHAAAYEGHRAVLLYTRTRRRRRSWSSKMIEALIYTYLVRNSAYPGWEERSTSVLIPWLGVPSRPCQLHPRGPRNPVVARTRFVAAMSVSQSASRGANKIVWILTLFWACLHTLLLRKPLHVCFM